MGLDNPIHIAFLLILLLLVFGAKRLPEMGRSLGDGMRGFKDALSGEGTNAAVATQTVAVAQPTLAAQPVLAAQPAVVVAAQQPAPVAAVQDTAQPLVQNAPAA
jgi:sec-independent protein translocase protein TatA